MLNESTIYESFVLPSKGLIYELNNGQQVDPNVTLRSMRVIEEMKRTSPSDTPYKVMSDIIEDCMKEKPTIHVYDMCIGDYQFLLHKLRIITYGSEYKIQVTCPNCNDYTESVADLESLDVNEYDESYNDSTTLTLPVTNKLIELKYQTPRDLDNISRKTKEHQKKTKLNLDYSIVYTLTSLIKKVDGQLLDAIQLEQFVKELPMRDVNAIIKQAEIMNGKIGLDAKIITKCSKCGYEQVVPFRITGEFFRPEIN